MGRNREMVRAYHEKFHPDHREATPLTITPELLSFRRRLHDEEVREVTEAWDAVENWIGTHRFRATDIAHLVHELADLVIVAYGTASFVGVDLDDVITVVMKANMSKSPNPDPAGKALKPSGFMPAAETIGAIVRALDAAPERCRHELVTAQCADCKPRPAPDPFEAPSRVRDGLGPVFTARFDSECDCCGLDVEEGDEARMWGGFACHADCAEKDAELPQNG
jgi:predicted HAD superfamily Cof-like phosphohydrolase